jgi:hypothetical protein
MDERAQLIAEYADGPRRLRRAVEEVAPARLAVRPAPGKWSAREIALHLCDAELSTVFRMKRAVAEPGSPVPAFDQERWTDALGPSQDLALALAAFAAMREEMAATLRRLPEEAWARTAVHPEAGPVSLLDWLRRAVRHTESHLAQIRALARVG